jgi:shikimate dehydrogenase
MRKFGLIGYPLGHSFSKKYFTEKFQSENITDCSYENYPLTSIDQLMALIISEPHLAGMNVTIPYKSEVIKLLDQISNEAEEIGAVNVLTIKRLNNRIFISGYNSDVTGIRDSLLPFINRDIRNALVLGTGGSSRAVCYVLKKLGITIKQVSRTKKHGLLLYSDINEALMQDTGIIINTTPLGMFPDIDSRPDINYNLLTEKHILFDLVYNPELTSFLKMGKERGCTTISGLKMLHSQAEKAWEIWNDVNLKFQ